MASFQARLAEKMKVFRSPGSLLVALMFVIGCGGMRDPSIVYTKSIDPNVVNGVAYDKASIAVDGVSTVVVPANAVVERHRADATCDITMRKELAVFGHPPERITISDARRNMGCAYRREGNVIYLATFGEFETDGHGTRSIGLAISAPDDIVVEKRNGLSGGGSQANDYFSSSEESDAGNEGATQWKKLRCVPVPHPKP